MIFLSVISIEWVHWWMDKEDMVYVYNEILLIHQKEWNSAICNNKDGTRVYYAKQNKY